MTCLHIDSQNFCPDCHSHRQSEYCDDKWNGSFPFNIMGLNSNYHQPHSCSCASYGNSDLHPLRLFNSFCHPNVHQDLAKESIVNEPSYRKRKKPFVSQHDNPERDAAYNCHPYQHNDINISRLLDRRPPPAPHPKPGGENKASHPKHFPQHNFWNRPRPDKVNPKNRIDKMTSTTGILSELGHRDKKVIKLKPILKKRNSEIPIKQIHKCNPGLDIRNKILNDSLTNLKSSQFRERIFYGPTPGIELNSNVSMAEKTSFESYQSVISSEKTKSGEIENCESASSQDKEEPSTESPEEGETEFSEQPEKEIPKDKKFNEDSVINLIRTTSLTVNKPQIVGTSYEDMSSDTPRIPSKPEPQLLIENYTKESLTAAKRSYSSNNIQTLCEMFANFHMKTKQEIAKSRALFEKQRDTDVDRSIVEDFNCSKEFCGFQSRPLSSFPQPALLKVMDWCKKKKIQGLHGRKFLRLNENGALMMNLPTSESCTDKSSPLERAFEAYIRRKQRKGLPLSLKKNRLKKAQV